MMNVSLRAGLVATTTGVAGALRLICGVEIPRCKRVRTGVGLV